MTQLNIKTIQVQENIFGKTLMLLKSFIENLQKKRAISKENKKYTEKPIGCFYSDYY